jgi:hypothetical protein
MLGMEEVEMGEAAGLQDRLPDGAMIGVLVEIPGIEGDHGSRLHRAHVPDDPLAQLVRGLEEMILSPRKTSHAQDSQAVRLRMTAASLALS